MCMDIDSFLSILNEDRVDQRSLKILSIFVIPCFTAECAYKIWWYSSGATAIPFLVNVLVSNTLACTLELFSWLYRTVVFFLVCILFCLICYLQILRLQDFAKVFQVDSDVESVLREHLRIRRHLKIISHRYRSFILFALILVTVIQLASLLSTTRSNTDLNIFKSGELAASAGPKKIVGFFYKAHEYAEMDPNFVGCVENALGIRKWLESQGHEYIVTDDKEGPGCEVEKHIPDAHVIITTPFHPGYITAERIKKAKNLQLLLTAGIGSDHVDLPAAGAAGLAVAEVTGSNVVSVAEDELMRILILVRNFLPGYKQVVNGDWNVAGIAYRAYDLEGKTVGTVGCGRIGRLLLQRLKPFGCNLLYHDRIKMDPELESQTGASFEEDLDKMLPKCDIIVVNTPLTEKTKGLFDKERIAKLKKGVLIVNNARGAIMDTQAVVDGCNSGHIGGYSGDVWYPQPAPKDHPWRYMPNQAMTPHISGTTIDAQLRYAAGVKDMLENYFKGEDFPPQHYIVKKGELASQYR